MNELVEAGADIVDLSELRVHLENSKHFTEFTIHRHRVLLTLLSLLRVTSTTTTQYNYYNQFSRKRVQELKTRKLSYRKEDRAMRPIYGCPGIFPES